MNICMSEKVSEKESSSWCNWYRGILLSLTDAGGGSIPRWSARKTQDRRPAERQGARTKKEKVSEKECHVERRCENCAPHKADLNLQLATCHSPLWPSSWSFFAVWCTENWWTTVYMLLERPVHLYCIMTTLPYSHEYGFVCLVFAAFVVPFECDWCWPGMWCIGRLYTLFRIPPESGAAYGELKIHTLVGHWDLLSCLWHRAVWTLQVKAISSRSGIMPVSGPCIDS